MRKEKKKHDLNGCGELKRSFPHVTGRTGRVLRGTVVYADKDLGGLRQTTGTKSAWRGARSEIRVARESSEREEGINV